MIHLPYPISSNRYWRTFRNRMVRSKEADEFKRVTAHAAFVAGWRVCDGPVAVALTFHPKTTKQGRASETRLDLDNVIKVTLDALNGVAWVDDRQVVKLLAQLGAAIPGGGLTVEIEQC